MLVHAIRPSAIARGIDWVRVLAEGLVPLMAVIADLRRLKEIRQRSHRMVVAYGTAVSHNINCGNLVWVWKLVSRLRVIPRIAFTTDLSLFSTTEEATTEIRRGM